MKKLFVGTFGVMVVLALLVGLFYAIIISKGVEAVSGEFENNDAARELIGKKFVVDGDTFRITNFKYPSTYEVKGSDETFAKELVEKNLIK